MAKLGASQLLTGLQRIPKLQFSMPADKIN